jgi:hypothetical protein
MPETTSRYVITHINESDGLRRLTLAQQGRETYVSRDQANHMLRTFLASGLPRVLTPGEMSTLEVRAVACYEGHHDPVAYYCDRFEVAGGAILRDGVPFIGVSSEELKPSEYGHSHVEIDAIRHWLCAELNAMTSRKLHEIIHAHKEA